MRGDWRAVGTFISWCTVPLNKGNNSSLWIDAKMVGARSYGGGPRVGGRKTGRRGRDRLSRGRRAQGQGRGRGNIQEDTEEAKGGGGGKGTKGEEPDRKGGESGNKELGAGLVIMTLNVDGVRRRQKRTALGQYVSGLRPQPDICIITETHLLEHEVDWLRMDTYERANESCREAEVEQSCGGVIIMVKTGLRYEKETELPNVRRPLNGCSIIVYPKQVGLAALRVTGVYFTPAARALESEVRMLAGRGSAKMVGGRKIGHLIGGDFNHPSWRPGYERWISNHGIWTLTDPMVGTFSSGNSLDKFLFVPGDEVPAVLLKEGDIADDEMEETYFYPRTVGEEEVVGNHRPVFLSLPYERERWPPVVRRLKVGEVDAEDWDRRDQRLLSLLDHKRRGAQQHLARGNVTTAFTEMTRVMEEVISDLYTRRPKKQRLRELKDLFEEFCKQNAKHPKVTEYKIVHYAGNVREEERLMREIQADGWKRMLATVDPANTTRLYKLIRKMGGRENKVFTYQCALPIRQGGEIYTGTKEKCEVLAQFFWDRFSAPSDLGEALTEGEGASFQECEEQQQQQHKGSKGGRKRGLRSNKEDMGG